MGRHKKSVNRPILPDAKYNSVVVTKFVSRMMLDGKKATCTKIVYEALDDNFVPVKSGLSYHPSNAHPLCIVAVNVQESPSTTSCKDGLTETTP